jgi:uncharacterized protein YggE
MKIAAWFAIASLLFAQGETGLLSRVPTIRAHGRATVTAKPDRVQIDIGVVSQGKTAQAASAANATQFSKVVAELKKLTGAGSEIQTVSYSVRPDYRYPKEGGTPSIAGYTATNVVRVESAKVDAAGEIIDAASASGANRIQSIRFTVKDERALRAQALREAAKDARSNADAMAAGLGLKVLRVLRVEDSPQPIPYPEQREVFAMRAASADAPPTPVEAGTIDVQASVMITVEIN